ncbi:helix-turn-helix domain-containing protein [Microbacterium sp. M1A1_1b]|uniref:Transcriptional regulator with XRE-family HTH domain n=1 Tax=Curtobacterium salicis TaxID=1779862 RepID=A0ABX0T1S7_9MICO|nr:XRE family transcriptional regulator [Curtobacterium sp. WW7]NII39450.1 transcriptional regulator with XRE-family HTH domain [Curtobacterium sp. WW7]
MSRSPRKTPRELAPEPWPEVKSPDPVAEAARVFAATLRAQVGERSTRSVAAAAGIHHVTLLRVLAGDSWPDIATLARLEIALDAKLWHGPQRDETQ